MASILQVEQIQGPTSGASANTITIPSGQTLDVNGTLSGDGSALTGTGGILQVVHSGQITSTAFSVTGTTATEITPLTLSITPTASDSKILWMGNVTQGAREDSFVGYYLQRNGTNLDIGDSAGSATRFTFGFHQDAGHGQYDIYSTHFQYLDSPNTTSSTEYKLLVTPLRTSSLTWYLNRPHNLDDANRSTGTSSVILMEIAAGVL